MLNFVLLFEFTFVFIEYSLQQQQASIITQTSELSSSLATFVTVLKRNCGSF